MSLFHDIIEGFFFPSDRRDYWKPEHYGLKGHAFTCPHPAGHTLNGYLFLSGTQETKGRVLFCHSGLFNREFNLPQVLFLIDAGYEVVSFDYSGYGLSGGKSRLDGLLADLEAVVHYDSEENRFQGPYIIFAQGIGCDAAMQFYHAHRSHVSMLILESMYYSRKGWIKDRWGPLVGDIGAAMLETTSIEPEAVLPEIHVPLLMVYPESGKYIRKSERLKVSSHLPKHALLWTVPKTQSFGIFNTHNGTWSIKALSFIEKKTKK